MKSLTSSAVLSSFLIERNRGERIESECIEAIRATVEQERPIEIIAIHEDLDLIKW